MPRRGGRHFTLLGQAEKAMEAFRWEIATELGLDTVIKDQGWEGLSTYEVGSIGGEMVKRIMIAGEMEVLRRFEAGERLSPQLPEGAHLNEFNLNSKHKEKASSRINRQQAVIPHPEMQIDNRVSNNPQYKH